MATRSPAFSKWSNWVTKTPLTVTWPKRRSCLTRVRGIGARAASSHGSSGPAVAGGRARIGSLPPADGTDRLVQLGQEPGAVLGRHGGRAAGGFAVPPALFEHLAQGQRLGDVVGRERVPPRV